MDRRAGPAAHAWAWAGLAGLLSAAVSAVAVRAAGPATIDPDASASVLYFQRIVALRHLEAFVPTTPKPLLTMVDGLLYAFAHDWRVLVWATILAQGVAVALGAMLVARLAGGVARLALAVPMEADPDAHRTGGAAETIAGVLAAGILAAALTLSGPQLLEVSRANSLVWALAGWLGAGLALSTQPRRYAVAGGALLFAGLIRTETWLLIVPAVAAATVLWLWRRGSGDRAGATSPLGLWISAAAFPLWALHDLLLTGDPTFSLTVPARYTAVYAPGLQAEAPLSFLASVADRFFADPVPLALSAVGLIALIATRRWWLLGGLMILFDGVLLLLTGLAARAVYVSARYYETPELAALITASIGAGALAGIVVLVLTRSMRSAGVPGLGRASSIASGAAVALGLAIGAWLVWPPAPLDRATTARLDQVRTASANAATAATALRALAPGGPDAWRDVPADTPGAPDPAAAKAEVLVPSLLRSRLAVELDLPLTAIGDSLAAFLPNGAAAALRPGQLVYHDGSADPSGRAYRRLYAPFESAEPVTLGPLTLRPVRSAPADGIWIVRVEGP